MQPLDASAGPGDLLRTKLAPPRPHAPLVPRPELLARLEAGLGRRITLLAAPAGFGKTTLVAAWLASARARADAPPLAWLTLDAGDSDPARFWRYLAAACQSLAGDAAHAPPPQAPQPPRPEALLTALLNDLARLPRRGILVLEDYHTIGAPEVHEALGWLLERLPDTLHVILMARADPPLPLARLRAHGAMAELRARDLRFTPAEIHTLLRAAGVPALLPEALAQLAASTEGWPAGLRLALLALQSQRPADPARLLAAFGGDQQHVLAYLTSEVLDAQPEPVRSFLLETSVLSRFTPELCDAVTLRDDGAALLAAAERADLFLVPLDDQPRLYRYHTLFGEAMRHEAHRRLGAPHLRALYERASRWYAAHGLPGEAIEAALAAEAFERAAALIDELTSDEQLRSTPRTVRRWVEQLPSALLPDHPELCLAYASAILFSEDRGAPATMRMLERPLELAEQAWRAQDARPRLGAALALRSMAAFWQGDHEYTELTARQALALLPADEIWWRPSMLLNLSMAALAGGRIGAAEQLALAARACYETNGNDYGRRAATLMLGEIAVQRGELAQAEQLYRQVGSEAGDDRVDEGYVLVGLAMLALLRGDLPEAERLAAQALDLAGAAGALGERLVESALLVPALLLRARTLRASGALSEAQRVVASLAARTLQYDGGRQRHAVRAEQARLALALGDLVAVQRWANAAAQRSEDMSLLQQERDALVVARWLVARGDPDAALRALDHWRAVALADERVLSELEIDALAALAQAAAGRASLAVQLAAGLLPRVRALGLRQLLLDQGEPMRGLLRELQHSARPELRGYLAELLAQFPQPDAPQPAAAHPTPSQAAGAGLPPDGEPLSPQERRVLRLLSAGLSNPEIADELMVSVNTIKTQVQSIFRKLGVSSRREARALARAGHEGTNQ